MPLLARLSVLWTPRSYTTGSVELMFAKVKLSLRIPAYERILDGCGCPKLRHVRNSRACRHLSARQKRRTIPFFGGSVDSVETYNSDVDCVRIFDGHGLHNQ